MMDDYLEIILDYFWMEDDKKSARFKCFEFILGEYNLENIDIEIFNLLLGFIITVDKLYGKQKYKE